MYRFVNYYKGSPNLRINMYICICFGSTDSSTHNHPLQIILMKWRVEYILDRLKDPKKIEIREDIYELNHDGITSKNVVSIFSPISSSWHTIIRVRLLVWKDSEVADGRSIADIQWWTKTFTSPIFTLIGSLYTN